MLTPEVFEIVLNNELKRAVEILSNVVDRCGDLGGGLLRLSDSGLRFLLHAVDEADTGAHQWQ